MDRGTPGIYVTGTDTGIGKTIASVALLHALRASGLAAVGMKPVASGCVHTALGWRNEDALALQAASQPSHPYDIHNPFALPEATAPQLAARRAGVTVSLARLQQAYASLSVGADVVVVEGAGGWLAPLADGLEQSQLARALALPVVLVVGLRLGCLNHARLSARAIAQDGLPFAGWIGNTLDPDFADAGAYRELLADAIDAPCLGWLPHGSDDARRASCLPDIARALRLLAGVPARSGTLY
jgi:dethiobiotin synthetase